jgi:hypothetical protein
MLIRPSSLEQFNKGVSKKLACHPSNFEPKTSWQHAKVFTTKPLQDFINKEEKVLTLLCLA